MGRWLITIGALLVVLGIASPWLAKLGLGHLPGDIHVERKGFDFHFPITSGLVVSIAISLLLWIFRR